MASIDLGKQVDGNEESISNLSGDTFLFCDEDSMVDNGNNGDNGDIGDNSDNGDIGDNSDNGDNMDNTSTDNIFTYAEVLQRENATMAEITPSSDTDNEESYLGYGRVLTTFERTHFHRDNVTPGRPCTAYFNSEYFVDSKAVFDKLTQLDIPRESVLCLQRRPSGDMVITFTNEQVKKKFVSNVVIRFRKSLSVINDEDMPLTFLNIYDAPHELSNDALTFRLRKYCIVHSARRGKLSRSQVNNGFRHFRVQIIQPIPSYLRFGKFLVRLSHDGQQRTCRRCNHADHFANECHNVVCFNCDELGHQSKECPGPVLCCICKRADHRARRCPFAWHRPSGISASSVNNSASDPRSGGHVTAPDVDPPPDPSSGGDVTAPAGDLAFPSGDVFSSCVPDSALLAAAGPSSQLPDTPVGPRALDKDGFLLWEKIAFGPAPNPSGPSSGEEVNSVEQPAELSASDQPANSSDTSAEVLSADLLSAPAGSSEVSADPSLSVTPPDVSAGPAADPSADQPAGPATVNDDPPSSSTDVPATDQPVSTPPAGKSRLPGISRCKPAPMPAILESLTRRPTRPSLPVTGKSSSSSTSAAPPEDSEEMEAQSSLKRKQVTPRKKGDPKKEKH